MITQFILKPIVDLMLVREPFNELTNYLWRTQMAFTNMLELTNNLQFRGHDATAENPSSPILVVESSFMIIEHFV